MELGPVFSGAIDFEMFWTSHLRDRGFSSSENSTKNMFDVALSSAGATIALATSFDENHPPENIIDG